MTSEVSPGGVCVNVGELRDEPVKERLDYSRIIPAMLFRFLSILTSRS